MLARTVTFQPTITLNPLTPSAIDPSVPAVRFNPSSSSMATTVVIFLLVFLFIAFFSIFARRLFAGVHSTEISRSRPPLRLSTNHQHPRYLAPSVRTAGLDPVTVRALPVITCAAGSKCKIKEAGVCVVCLGEFEEGERVKVIPGCGHVFHPGCIDGWLVLQGSCPLCRCSQVLGTGAGTAEFWVDLDGGAHEESEEEEEEEGKLGRSRSFSGRVEGEGAVSLRRTCSV